MAQTFQTPADAGEAFARWIARTGYSDATQAAYTAKVRAFLDWLEAGGSEYSGALSDEHVRDYAVRDFRRELMVAQKAADATVEAYLSAIGAFYGWLGLPRPRVKRAKQPKRAPKSLTTDQLRKVLRAAERRGPRDFAVAMMLFQTAVRVSELVALDTDDLFISERMGQADVRHGKGGEARRVPVPADARAALRTWLAVRRELGHPEVGPLFLSRRGSRLSTRRVQSLMSQLGDEAGVPVTPHVLRHTYARHFLEQGGDVAALQDALGHRNLSSTQVYTAPHGDAVAEAAERVRIDL